MEHGRRRSGQMIRKYTAKHLFCRQVKEENA